MANRHGPTDTSPKEKKFWVLRSAFRVSPFLILSLLSLLAATWQLLTTGGGFDGLRFPFLLSLLVFAIMVFGTDLLLKYLLKLRLLLLWSIETFLALCLLYYWIIV